MFRNIFEINMTKKEDRDMMTEDQTLGNGVQVTE